MPDSCVRISFCMSKTNILKLGEYINIVRNLRVLIRLFINTRLQIICVGVCVHASKYIHDFIWMWFRIEVGYVEEWKLTVTNIKHIVVRFKRLWGAS